MGPDENFERLKGLNEYHQLRITGLEVATSTQLLMNGLIGLYFIKWAKSNNKTKTETQMG